MARDFWWQGFGLNDFDARIRPLASSPILANPPSFQRHFGDDVRRVLLTQLEPASCQMSDNGRVHDSERVESGRSPAPWSADRACESAARRPARPQVCLGQRSARQTIKSVSAISSATTIL